MAISEIISPAPAILFSDMNDSPTANIFTASILAIFL
jgi:hypothetical protein